jgi:DNA invertase Pin-like site-specific DNA recombinase
MREIVNIVNSIRSHELNHRQFQQFLSELEAEHGDILCYTEVRWLSRGKALNRVLELKDQIGEFMARKENLFFISMILSG